MKYLKINYRNYNVHSVGVDETSIVSESRLKKMEEDNRFRSVKVIREATHEEKENAMFLEKMSALLD